MTIEECVRDTILSQSVVLYSDHAEGCTDSIFRSQYASNGGFPHGGPPLPLIAGRASFPIQRRLESDAAARAGPPRVRVGLVPSPGVRGGEPGGEQRRRAGRQRHEVDTPPGTSRPMLGVAHVGPPFSSALRRPPRRRMNGSESNDSDLSLSIKSAVLPRGNKSSQNA